MSCLGSPRAPGGDAVTQKLPGAWPRTQRTLMATLGDACGMGASTGDTDTRTGASFENRVFGWKRPIVVFQMENVCGHEPCGLFCDPHISPPPSLPPSLRTFTKCPLRASEAAVRGRSGTRPPRTRGTDMYKNAALRGREGRFATLCNEAAGTGLWCRGPS